MMGNDFGSARTCNPQLRGPMLHPLGHTRWRLCRLTFGFLADILFFGPKAYVRMRYT